MKTIRTTNHRDRMARNTLTAAVALVATLAAITSTLAEAAPPAEQRPFAALPPMPIAVYNNFTDRDLKATFAYLRTVPAIRNKVPDPVPPVAAASTPG